MESLRKPSRRRERYPMPPWFREALEREGLTGKYDERPPYQRNDYIGWIEQAVHPETRDKRLAQMLEELRNGGKYMNMPYRVKK